ncbi:hypothetical protein JTB14_031576 [Gonioctena quinquepunctata]|nr:hypothetical protein JTB14_031576 [Gonioctena quinquepunctata]
MIAYNILIFTLLVGLCSTAKLKNIVGDGCTITDYSQVSSVVNSCTNIVLSSIFVPAGVTFRLDLKAGTTLTIDGIIKFGFANWVGPLMHIQGNGITVKGTIGSKIDGEGEKYWDGKGGGGTRKPVTLSINANNAFFENIHIRNCPERCTSLLGDHLDLNYWNIDVSDGDKDGLGRNTDGFDVGGNNIQIRNTVVKNQDDCIGVGRGTNMHFRNIVCHGRGLSIVSGMDMTTYENNLIRNITYTHCSIIGSTNGIDVRTVKHGGPGLIQDVTYSHITMTGMQLWVLGIHQDNTENDGNPGTNVPIRGLTMRDIKISATGNMARGVQVLCAPGYCSDWTWSDVTVVGNTFPCNMTVVPAGKTLALNLRQGTSLTFDGIVKFGFSNWDGPLVQVQGSGITVKGTQGSKIDAEGAKYWDGKGGSGPRKPVLFAMNVNGGNFENIHLLNCPERCAAVLGSDLHLNYWNIDVSAADKDDLGRNTDGFDIVGNNIEIKNSVVKNQDDCVVVNGGTNMHFRNIVCSGGHGLSLAVGMDSKSNIVRNITFTQCTVINSSGGVHVKTVKDGGPGVIEDITYSHITLEGITWYGIRVQQDYPYNDDNPVGNVPIKGLTLRDVKGTMNSAYSIPISVSCAAGACSDWSWSDISITEKTHLHKKKTTRTQATKIILAPRTLISAITAEQSSLYVLMNPIWTYGIQLSGTASNTNLKILERFQSNVLRTIPNAPRFVPNTSIRRDLHMTAVKEEVATNTQRSKD